MLLLFLLLLCNVDYVLFGSEIENIHEHEDKNRFVHSQPVSQLTNAMNWQLFRAHNKFLLVVLSWWDHSIFGFVDAKFYSNDVVAKSSSNSIWKGGVHRRFFFVLIIFATANIFEIYIASSKCEFVCEANRAAHDSTYPICSLVNISKEISIRFNSTFQKPCVFDDWMNNK